MFDKQSFLVLALKDLVCLCGGDGISKQQVEIIKNGSAKTTENTKKGVVVLDRTMSDSFLPEVSSSLLLGVASHHPCYI